ncbi:MAG: substrate-binding domain-containing protein [Verrucomicrobia bacterium]|jgi:LacI family transcriptional regulator|nr:substrate-binding domain-containing protein [Verrucomicrobiota bacterium]
MRNGKQTVGAQNDQPVVYMLLQGATHDMGHEAELFDAARRRGWRLIDLKLFQDSVLPDLLSPQGVLIGHLPDFPQVLPLRKLGCPVVRVGYRRHRDDGEVPAVLADTEAAGRLAAEHFAERGFQHVGYVGYEPLALEVPLYKGMLARAEELGMVCHVLALPKFTEADEGRLLHREKLEIRNRQIAEWIKRVPKQMGLLTFSDRMAVRLCMVCQLAGIDVPGDVAVLGHGNSVRICECASVRLSSIPLGGTTLAEKSVQLLQDLMDGGAAPTEPLIVPPEALVVRESTDVLATADPVAAQAVRFLWQHLGQNIGVADVASAVSVSRRNLEVRFKEAVGRGVNAELRRRRLEQCCRLLETTDIPIADIVPMIGFRSQAYLHAAFRRKHGMTPRQYRVMRTGA